MISAVLQSTASFARSAVLLVVCCSCVVLTSWAGSPGSPSVEQPVPGQVCALVARTTERAIVWTTRRDQVLRFHFATYTLGGEPRIEPIEIGTGGQVEPSCGLAYRDGHYAVALPHYDGIFGHEGDLSFASLDPETGQAGGWRVLGSTKGGDEHTVESLASADRGYTLRFHTTPRPQSRRLELDPQGNVLEDPGR